jgi:hypothetical protein
MNLVKFAADVARDQPLRTFFNEERGRLKWTFTDSWGPNRGARR